MPVPVNKLHCLKTTYKHHLCLLKQFHLLQDKLNKLKDIAILTN